MELAVESLETPALTKAQLAEMLFEQIGLNKRESKDMIDAFFDLVTDSLVNGRGREDFRLRQLSDPHQGASTGTQSAHRRTGSHRGASGGHVPRQPTSSRNRCKLP
jgi:hypothetical protein